MRMIVCPVCGDKRCVHASNHDAPCAQTDIYAHNAWVERAALEAAASPTPAAQASIGELRVGQDPDGSVWIYIDGDADRGIFGAAIQVPTKDAPAALLHAQRLEKAKHAIHTDQFGNTWLQARAERAAVPASPNDGDTLWLWKNGDHFLAFTHLYPCYSPGGDPMTLGEPVARAVFRSSHNRGHK